MNHTRHEFEPTFYVMWLMSNVLLAGLFCVAVQHL